MSTPGRQLMRCVAKKFDLKPATDALCAPELKFRILPRASFIGVRFTAFHCSIPYTTSRLQTVGLTDQLVDAGHKTVPSMLTSCSRMTCRNCCCLQVSVRNCIDYLLVASSSRSVASEFMKYIMASMLMDFHVKNIRNTVFS
jgi:hypothetical protein